MDRGHGRKSSAAEIEKILIARMEERYRDEKACNDVRAFFEEQGAGHAIPLIVRESERKERIWRSGDGEGGRRPGPVAASPTDPSPPPTNRGGTFHEHAAKPENFTARSKIMGGYDGGVEVGFNGEWDPDEFSLLTAELDAAKLASQDAAEGYGAEEKSNFVLLAGRPFVILPRSAGGGITYRYVLEGDGFKLYIHSNPTNEIQAVRVRYMAEGLIGRDLFAKHAELLELLHDMGFSVTQEKISRVDLQVMIFRDVTEFMKLILNGNAVCVARKGQFNTNGSSIETYRLGRGGQQVCIYDKRTELFETKQANEAKFWLMVNECFGEEWLYEEIPTTRIEFRIKREVLKDMGIHSMHDLLEHEAGLARYCCCSWFRILSDKKQKGHTHEQETAPVWREVQLLFEKWFPGVDGHRLDVKREYDRKIKAQPIELERQFVGCMKTWGALLMGGVEDFGVFVTNVTETLERNMLEIFAGMIDRARKLGIRTGVTDYIADPEHAMSTAALDRHRDRVRFGLRTMSSSALLE